MEHSVPKLCALGVEPVLWNIQYRMHAAINAFPSKYMYNNMIRDGHDSVSWAAPAGFPWPVPSKPLCSVDCNEQEQKTGTSFTNTLEREVIAKVIGLLAGHVPFEDIGVITGYRTQRELLKDSLDLGVDVNSIDGFQGREKRCHHHIYRPVQPRRLSWILARSSTGQRSNDSISLWIDCARVHEHTETRVADLA